MIKIVFLTGTRADYGKIKTLMQKVENSEKFELHVFATGMHMLSKYGKTYLEIIKDGFSNIYTYINQTESLGMDFILSNTILGFANYIAELKPDAIVVHGDRLEALAGAIVGAFNNIRVFHIEGGEVSGTIDESIRHAVTKFSHFHLVANEESKKRIMQLGEPEKNIFTIGSPDIDIMMSESLPSLYEVFEHYGIKFKSNYSILMYHPVTTELNCIKQHIKNVVDAVIESKQNYVVIFPNNDAGTDIIIEEYERLKNNFHFRIIPSMKFEYFLTLLRNTDFIMGNSSSGIREAGVYGVPAVDIGSRQKGRYLKSAKSHIIHCNEDKNEILKAIEKAKVKTCKKKSEFGEGKSADEFYSVLCREDIWKKSIQKHFVDIDF